MLPETPAVERYAAPYGDLHPALVCPDVACSTGDLNASLDVDALVLRAIAARLRDRALPRRLRRLADLDAALLDQVASNCEQEYAR